MMTKTSLLLMFTLVCPFKDALLFLKNCCAHSRAAESWLLSMRPVQKGEQGSRKSSTSLTSWIWDDVLY